MFLIEKEKLIDLFTKASICKNDVVTLLVKEDSVSFVLNIKNTLAFRYICPGIYGNVTKITVNGINRVVAYLKTLADEKLQIYEKEDKLIFADSANENSLAIANDKKDYSFDEERFLKNLSGVSTEETVFLLEEHVKKITDVFKKLNAEALVFYNKDGFLNSNIKGKDITSNIKLVTTSNNKSIILNKYIYNILFLLKEVEIKYNNKLIFLTKKDKITDSTAELLLAGMRE